ncbi:hypothetical protein [Actinomycetospora endophytica]|uniref:hypothetical protein n=1 Tax=Actinomycetospora endophytica TaxID=2291215 RepID=UPI001E6480FB|nr:hypothetical protein [Actinomycetospora endophytica]
MTVLPAAGARASYLLVSQALVRPFNGEGAGWTLTGYREGARCWSKDLARHGAPAGASAATAQAVADRVLRRDGIATGGDWHAIAAPEGDEHGAFWVVAAPPAPGSPRRRAMRGLHGRSR